MKSLPRLVTLALLVIVPCSANAQSSAGDDTSPPLRWWKGNLHTHSFWSDGDDFPEMIADWYLQRDYNFLALSDHNVLSDGIRWKSMEDILKKAEPDVLEKYQKRFGTAWVETRGEKGTASHEVRLKPLDEFSRLVESAGKFIMIPGEEISDSVKISDSAQDKPVYKPVHMNVTNVKEKIAPVGGDTVRAAIANNLRVVLEQEKRTGRQMLPHLNHPNFHYAVTAEDLASVIPERFYEIYNGHPGVNQLGDDDHMSIERMWDVVNAIRLTQLSAEPLMGIATDDSHEYHGQEGARPGRGWVMVQARYLTPEHLILALKAGDFYASSGVKISGIQFDDSSQTLSVDIESDGDATFETQFIATLRADAEGELPSASSIGTVVARAAGLKPSYRLTGKELYVRALVTSSQDHSDPSIPGQKKQAWTQPVGWKIQ